MNIVQNRPWMEIQKTTTGESYVSMREDAVVIVALNHKDEILFIEEESIAYQVPALTLPTGGVELNELPEITADRELQEEVGYHAEDLTYIGTLHPSIKYMQWQCHVYLARNLMASQKNGDESSPIKVKALPISQFDQAVNSKHVSDSTTIAAVGLVRNYLSA